MLVFELIGCWTAGAAGNSDRDKWVADEEKTQMQRGGAGDADAGRCEQRSVLFAESINLRVSGDEEGGLRVA